MGHKASATFDSEATWKLSSMRVHQQWPLNYTCVGKNLLTVFNIMLNALG